AGREAGAGPGRRARRPGPGAELGAARRYVLGSMALSTATHAGLASTLSALVGAGLPADWLSEHQRALAEVTVDEVTAAARRYLQPRSEERRVGKECRSRG